MASISGRGIGVKPCIFLADSIHIVCIQEGNVLVSVHHMGVNSSPALSLLEAIRLYCINFNFAIPQ